MFIRAKASPLRTTDRPGQLAGCNPRRHSGRKHRAGRALSREGRRRNCSSFCCLKCVILTFIIFFGFAQTFFLPGKSN
ncbi:hypothetical protein DXC97_15425 [Lachnospiraceae bacterium TF09-5]|nr:hypothetical protein DXC97_15425 [Lachnospiraceae bacterium TF09-5]